MIERGGGHRRAWLASAYRRRLSLRPPRRAVLALALVLAVTGPDALAFTQADDLGASGTRGERLDRCVVELTVDSAPDPLGNVERSASIVIREDVNQPLHYAGGSAFIQGARQIGLTQIDEGLISRCARGVEPEEVLDLVQNGADGTFGSETLISFSFTIARRVPPRRPIRPPALSDGRYTYAVTGTPNTPPTARAGPDQLADPGDRVSLNGSGTDPDNDQLALRWAQVSGPAVSLFGPEGPTASFVAPAAEPGPGGDTLVFEFTASDGVGEPATARTHVRLRPDPSSSPEVDAGPTQKVGSERRVRLDGTATDPDPGDSLTLAWTQLEGPPVALDDPTARTPSFTAPRLDAGSPPLVLRFELRATDTGGNASADTVAVTVEPEPAPAAEPRASTAAPVVDAGPDRTVTSESAVRLTGSATDPGPDDRLSLFWTQVEGPPVALTDPTSAQPEFIAPSLEPGDPAVELRFELRATDAEGTTATDGIVVTVEAPHAESSRGAVAVVLSNAPSRLSAVVPFDLTVTFDRAVRGFDPRDIRVNQGRVIALSGTGRRYTATLLPDRPGLVRLRVPAKVATAADDRSNARSNRVDVLVSGASTTERHIEAFVAQRVRAVSRSQPRLLDQLASTGPHADLSVDGRGVRFDLATAGNAALWTSLTGHRSRGGDTFDFAQVAIGANILRRPGLIGGVMLQYDTAKLVEGSAEVEGRGWHAGPYVILGSADRPGVLEASALFGRTRNSATLFGGEAETFFGTRSALQMRYTGVFGSDTIQWLPSISMARVVETSKAYRNRAGEPISGQEVALTEIAFDGRARLSLSDARLILSPGVTFGADALRRDERTTERGSFYGASLGVEWRPSPRVLLSGSIDVRETPGRSARSTGVTLGASLRF